MKLLSLSALAITALLDFTNAAALQTPKSTFTPARPPAIPLAVRSPYLSTWLFAGSDGGNGGYLAGQWPQFWAYVYSKLYSLSRLTCFQVGKLPVGLV